MFTSTFMTTVWTTSANVYVELINKDNKWMISYSFRVDTKHRITDSCTWKLIRKDEDNWVSYSAFTTIWWTTLHIFFTLSRKAAHHLWQHYHPPFTDVYQLHISSLCNFPIRDEKYVPKFTWQKSLFHQM